MKDEWLRAAISDDTLVASLLLRLKDSFPSSSSTTTTHSHSHSHPTIQTFFILKPLPPSWGLRLPRSKPSSTSSSSFFDKKRRSPTTPLSWTNGGASPSDACDDSLSSHHHPPPPPPSHRFRSKISASAEAPTTTTTNKRPRRKKTFVELKEEEALLMKERSDLKKELATLRVTLKDQKSLNDNLKRIKLDLQADSRIKPEANSFDECNNRNNGLSEAASSSVTKEDKMEEASEPVSCPTKECEISQDALFMLPDLNMVPDEDSIVGMSS